MKVAIYHPWIYLKSGLERTILEIARRSRHDWTILTSHFDAEGTYPELSTMGVQQLDRVSVVRDYGAVMRAAVTIARTRLPLQDHDALVVSCDGLGSLVNFRNRSVPSICLCFTPLRAVYDEEYRKRHLNHHRLRLPFAMMAEALYRAVDVASWRRFQHVFCASETVRARVERGRLRANGAMEVLYPGIAAEDIEPSDQFERFFFLPGRMMWTKNLELGIDAFRTFRESRQDASSWRLIMAGMVDRKSEEYFARLQEMVGDDPGIQFHMNPSDAEMRDLYRRCYALLFTAFNEDLGLTPLEGACRGKPTVAVNRGGPTEIIRDGETGFLRAPNADEFAEAMTKLADDHDLTRQLGLAAADFVRQFTWEKFVARIDDHLDTLSRPKSVRASASTDVG